MGIKKTDGKSAVYCGAGHDRLAPKYPAIESGASGVYVARHPWEVEKDPSRPFLFYPAAWGYVYGFAVSRAELREGAAQVELDCEGYRKLSAAVEEDAARDSFHAYRAKLGWVVERARHYAEKTGLDAREILDAWERNRTYWYMNYYQESNQPVLGNAEKARVFETQEELLRALGQAGFRCPACGGVSQSPYRCDTGLEMSRGKICDWQVGGLLRDLGKGVFIFVKEEARGETIFKPLAWERAGA